MRRVAITLHSPVFLFVRVISTVVSGTTTAWMW